MSFRGNTVAAVGGGVAGLGVLPRGPNTEGMHHQEKP